MLIAAFKLAQAALFIAAGVSVLRLMHHDLSDMVLQWARHMHFSPEFTLRRLRSRQGFNFE